MAKPSSLWSWFKSRSLVGKIGVAFGLVVIVTLLSFAAGAIGHRIAYNRYTKKEAARMKQVQDALAAAEKSTRSAEAKEAKAEVLAEQNAAKAKTTSADKQALETEIAKREADIQNAYQHDQDYINSNLTECDRCRDICSRVAALARTNPNLAQYQCQPDACDEQCLAAAP